MGDVKSKNLYELLGNDSDQDSDKEPSPPPKVADKPVPRTGKRDASGAAPSEARGAPAADRGGRGPRRGGATGSDQAFRDREAGSVNNRGKPTDDGLRHDRHSDRLGGGRVQTDERGSRGRGGRGGRGYRGDRQNRGFPNEHPKQANQSWGATTGESEWKDEQEGEAIAKADEKDEATTGAGAEGAPAADADTVAPTNGSAGAPAAAEPAQEPAEPEDNSRSYADYLADLAAKKLALGTGVPEARKPNEGSKAKKEWANAKPVSSKDEEEGDYISSTKEKAKRERQRKEKMRVEVDLRYVEPSQGGGRGGGGGGERGGRGGGRGGRGGRGGGEFRGRGGRGGEFRGQSQGQGGSFRGRARGEGVNVADETAFPSLGGGKGE